MLLTMKENKRIKVLQEVIGKKITVSEAVRQIEVSERHGWRLLAKLKEGGPLALAHGNRGRPSDRQLSKEVKEMVINLRRTTYDGFNDRHFTDSLASEEKIKIGRESVRKWLRSAGIISTRKVKKRKHRLRRSRKERFGEMLQGDGSPHDWLEGRGPELTLIHFVDDATGYTWADFFYSENTYAYFSVVKDVLFKNGIPRSLYVDNHSVFRVNHENTKEEQLTGNRPKTHFARAMEELGIAVIFAGSPQGKGRVERAGGVDQDRLVSELRKAKASTIEEARGVLKEYLKKRNKWFTVEAKDSNTAFLKLPENFNLLQVLCWKEQRVVANDNTISFHGKTLQIPAHPNRYSFAKARVNVHICLDGSVHVFYKHERIAYFKNVMKDRELFNIMPAQDYNLRDNFNLTFLLGH